MTSEAFTKLPPTGDTRRMLNAIRVAAVNANYPGRITYDPFQVLVPAHISEMMLLESIRLAIEGEEQT